ncbi:glycosyltransferase, partial [Candidatus Gribaldobacteria bacterium]|nr:glycosyltransferase [Candidatus Gribaldobacteria bacterium]
MKILYLITQSDLGGAQKYVFDLALAFKKEFNVVVAAGKQTGELFNELNKENIRSIALKHLKRLPNPLGILLCFLEIRKLVKKERPDILHLNSTIAGFLGSLAVLNLKTKPKIVYTVHGWAFLEPNALKKILFYLLEKTTASLKDKFIILSEFEKQVALKKKICSKTKITIIPNGIEKIKFFSKETAREKLGLIEKNKAIVGVIANPYKTKGLKYLLKAWPEAVIVGDGPEKNK